MELYCVCQQQYDPTRWMIACDSCSQWFHGDCVGLDPGVSSLALVYYCDQCRAASGSEPKWRRKCRLSTCFEPARVEQRSKYCSDAHGIEFFQQAIRRVDDAEPADVKGIASQLHSLDALHSICSNTPPSCNQDDAKAVTEAYSQPVNGTDTASEHRNPKLQAQIAILSQALEHKTALSAQRTAESGRRIEICGFDTKLQAALEGVDGLSPLSSLCPTVASRCTRHEWWQFIYERRIRLECGDEVDDFVPPDLQKGITRIDDGRRLHVPLDR